MITILSALICLKGMCYQVTVPAPATLQMESCAYVGATIARQFVDRRWSIKEVECHSGRQI